MTDREKVVKGLECCLGDTRTDLPNLCTICPYAHGSYATQTCGKKLREDALALLKAQEQKCRECGEATSKAIQELQAKLKAQEPQGTPEAEWLLYKGMRGATCSYCKHTFDDVYDVENYDYYCRHCGAKMIRMRAMKWK